MKNKYRNIKITYNNIKFDSILEKDVYIYFLKLKDEGKIKNIKLQPKYILQEGFRDFKGRAIRAIEYRADFEVEWSDGRIIVYDAKGMETKDFTLKYKMYLYRYDKPLILVKKLVSGFYDKKTNERIE